MEIYFAIFINCDNIIILLDIINFINFFFIEQKIIISKFNFIMIVINVEFTIIINYFVNWVYYFIIYFKVYNSNNSLFLIHYIRKWFLFPLYQTYDHHHQYSIQFLHLHLLTNPLHLILINFHTRLHHNHFHYNTIIIYLIAIIIFIIFINNYFNFIIFVDFIFIIFIAIDNVLYYHKIHQNSLNPHHRHHLY